MSGFEDGEDPLSPDIIDFIACLRDARVDFVLVGAFALGVHGYVRATADIDFLFRRTRANVRRLRAALLTFGAPVEVLDEDALLAPSIVTQFGQPPHRIDLMGEIDGVTFAEVWKGAVESAVAGHSVRVIGLRELRRNKRASGRRKDLADLERLDALR